MSQNRSSAVMQQRREPHDSLDFFPTPPWATRALCERLCQGQPAWLARRTAWDPCCGEGDMVRPLREYFRHVQASDVHDYSSTFAEQDDTLDFAADWAGMSGRSADWIVTNPPFRLALPIIQNAIALADVGVAILARTALLEGCDRYGKLFRVRPPSQVLQFVERVPMRKGRLDPKLSSATAYCWLVWRHSYREVETTFDWIAPCRKRLERAGDYPAPTAAEPIAATERMI